MRRAIAYNIVYTVDFGHQLHVAGHRAAKVGCYPTLGLAALVTCDLVELPFIRSIFAARQKSRGFNHPCKPHFILWI